MMKTCTNAPVTILQQNGKRTSWVPPVLMKEKTKKKNSNNNNNKILLIKCRKKKEPTGIIASRFGT